MQLTRTFALLLSLGFTVLIPNNLAHASDHAACNNTVTGNSVVYGCDNTVTGSDDVVTGDGNFVSGSGNHVDGSGMNVSGRVVGC